MGMEKKIKITWSKNHFYAKISILAKNYFFPLKKSKILRKIPRSGRSRSRLVLRNILSVRPPPILKTRPKVYRFGLREKEKKEKKKKNKTKKKKKKRKKKKKKKKKK